MFLLAFLTSAGSASAAFPGENGRFVFSFTHHTPAGVDETDLATVTAAGADFHVVSGCDYECYHHGADWSPSGRRFVYALEANGSEFIETRRADGSRRKIIRTGYLKSFGSPVWSPDAQRIAFTKQGDIFLINRDRTNFTRVTTTKRGERDLDWSSLNRLVFVKNCDLFMMRPNGAHVRRLTNTDACESAPDWSPTGTSLTFERRVSGEFPKIWTIDRSGANARLLGAGDSPAWAPDGTLIAYSASNGIHAVEPSGLGDVLIGSGGFGLDWQPIVP